MSVEENKAIVRRLLEEVWSEGNLDVIPEIIHQDWVPKDRSLDARPRNGTSGIRIFVEIYRSVFPDLKYTIHEMIAEGDRVVVSWIAEGTHTGRIDRWNVDLVPTGRQIRSWGVGIYKIFDRQIKAMDVYWSPMGPLEALAVAQLLNQAK